MGIFDFLKPKSSNGIFVTESAFEKNRDNQMKMTPLIIEQLRKLNVTEEKELKLEFFFYTNKAEKAQEFATEIEKLNYLVKHRISTGLKKTFIITGWTTKMKMENGIVQSWTKQMCELGYKFDCDFDGWGTTPDQE